MIIPSGVQKRLLCPALVLLGLLSLAQAAVTNITVDDQDARIKYTPFSSWKRVEGSDFDAGGGHMMTEDVNAFAEISLPFVSFYYLSALYPYAVTTDIYLDGILIKTVDLQDPDTPESDTGSGPGTVASGVVASFTGTNNSQHTVRISVPKGDTPGYAVLDAFVFAIDPSSTSTSSQSTSTVPTATTHSSLTSTSSSTPSPVSAAQNNEATHKAHSLTIALGVVLPILAILLLFLFWWACIRKKRRSSSDRETPLFDQEAMGGRPVSGQDGGYVAPPVTSEAAGAVVSAAAFRKTRRKAPPPPGPPSYTTGGATQDAWSGPNSAGPRPMRSGSLSDAALSVVGGPPPRASQGGHIDGRG